MKHWLNMYAAPILIGLVAGIFVLASMAPHYDTVMVDQIVGSANGLPHIGTPDRPAGLICTQRIQVNTYYNDGESIICAVESAVTPTRTINGSLDFHVIDKNLLIYGPAGTEKLPLTALSP